MKKHRSLLESISHGIDVPVKTQARTERKEPIKKTFCSNIGLYYAHIAETRKKESPNFYAKFTVKLDEIKFTFMRALKKNISWNEIMLSAWSKQGFRQYSINSPLTEYLCTRKFKKDRSSLY